NRRLALNLEDCLIPIGEDWNINISRVLRNIVIVYIYMNLSRITFVSFITFRTPLAGLSILSIHSLGNCNPGNVKIHYLSEVLSELVEISIAILRKFANLSNSYSFYVLH